MSGVALPSEAKRLLLERMLRGEGAERRGAAARVKPRVPGVTVPISADQRNIFLHAAMAPELPLYNEPFTIHRTGPFDLGVMEESFNLFLRRHEAWRTAFETENGEIIQRILPELRLRLPLVDLSALPAADRAAAAVRRAAEDARKPFDLAVAPLFRAEVLRLDAMTHRINLTVHQIIFDGVSVFGVLMPELVALYTALSRGEEPDLPAPRLQFGDYALWRQAQADSAEAGGQMAYWRTALGGELPVLKLPTDHLRPPSLTYRGGVESFVLPPTLTARLKELSREEGVTLYTTLLAGFTALLHRYTGQDDLVVGGVTDTRKRPELQPLLGYFLNSIALRLHPKATTPFRDYAAQLRRIVAEAIDASDVPFDRVVRELQPRREINMHPLFQVMFSIEPPADGFADGWDMTHLDAQSGAAKVDLFLQIDERRDELIGRFIYSADLFEAATIRRMAGHWRNLLEALASDPGCPLGQLSLLDAAEMRQLQGWNDTERAIPPRNLAQWFEAQAKATPDRAALTFEGETLTYRALDRRATRLAARLAAAGVEKGGLVALCVERSIDMVASVLGVLKAGAAYLPLDSEFPAKRLAFILEDAAPRVMLTQRALAAKLPPTQAHLLFCDEEDEILPDAAPLAVAAPDDIAYVLYTSGSTGKPKGVEVSHRAVVNLLAAMQRAPGFAAADTLLAVTTLAFDIATLEVLLPLLSGGRIVLANREAVSEPWRLAALIDESRCTVMQATPATWRWLIETGWSGRPDLKILCGGEALTRDLVDKLLARCGSLWNMYGPTETTIWSCVHNVKRGAGPVPIGRPIDNTTVHILDAAGNALPVGVPGELHIGGAGVARGYLRRDALTRERFVVSAAADGARLYRTGDMARWRSDGVLECLGRSDDQVKIRGFRVGLTEIEATLETHPEVAAAAVAVRADALGEKSLIGYFVARDGAAPQTAEIDAFLRELLPDYMVPARLMPMLALPMTPNSKVDRNALPAPTAVPTPDFVPPQGEQEEKLADIWQEVLGVPRIGRHDNFFDLGGHSLLVATLLRRIESSFGRRLPMAAVFSAPKIGAMAALLREGNAAGETRRIIPIQPKGKRSPLFWLFGGPTVRPLSEAMGTDHPFLGVTLDPEQIRRLGNAPRFEDIAAGMVRNIRDKYPRGPYHVGGWCTAGILAYEVSRQLMAEGGEMGQLVIVHGINPVHANRLDEVTVELSKLKYHFSEALQRRGKDRWRYAGEHARDFIDRLIPHGLRSRDENDDPFPLVLDRAAHAYVPGPYAGSVTLFQPISRPKIFDFRPGWEEVVAGRFRAYEVPGDHRSMLEPPHVQQLGAWVAASLIMARPVSQDEQRRAAE